MSSAELSIKMAVRCGLPKKLPGPPPPTMPTFILTLDMSDLPFFLRLVSDDRTGHNQPTGGQLCASGWLVRSIQNSGIIRI